MANSVLEQKLESLRHCVVRIQSKRLDSVEALLNDQDTQDILVLNITRAVQLCVDIASHLISSSSEPMPNTMGDTFVTLTKLGYIDDALANKMKRSVGFRNIAVHNYEQVNWEVVHAISTQHLDDFKLFALAVNEA